MVQVRDACQFIEKNNKKGSKVKKKKKEVWDTVCTIRVKEEQFSQSSCWGQANNNNSIHQDLMSRKDWPRNNKGSKASQMCRMEATILQITAYICTSDRQFSQFEPSR